MAVVIGNINAVEYHDYWSNFRMKELPLSTEGLMAVAL